MSLSRPTMSAIRFGYGIRPGEEPPDGPEALLAQLDEASAAELRFPVEGIDARHAAIVELNRRLAAAKSKDKEENRRRVRPIVAEMRGVMARDQHARVAQSAFSPHGFVERLASFWVDHFSVSVRKQRTIYLTVALYEAEALRPNMSGPFSQLLRASIQHPAMLIYLDQIKSIGPNSRRASRSGRGLNENLGRELLELHTLGADGGYTQEDVRAAALVLTGLNIDRSTGQTDFRRQIAEPGPLTFMGKTYGGRRRSIEDIDEMLDDLAAMPQTGRHICRKLAVHFISDKPPEALVEAMNAAWTKSGGNLRDVYAAMLKHPLSWENPGQKARQPYDFIVAGLRALDVPERNLAMPERREDDDEDDMEMSMTRTAAPMAAKASNAGQPEMSAEEREDAEDEARQTKAERRKYRLPANPITVGALRKLGQPVWQPASPAGFEEGFDIWVSSAQLTARIEWAQRASAKFAGRTSPNELLKAVLRDAARDDTIKIVSQAPNRTAGTTLILASPEFNRR